MKFLRQNLNLNYNYKDEQAYFYSREQKIRYKHDSFLFSFFKNRQAE
jgi:hypothetical protein